MRRWVLSVVDFPALLALAWYVLKIAKVEKSTDPPGVRVQFEFVDGEQAGRTYVAVLPLPIRPASLTASFFAAATGTAVVAGGTVAPKAAVGRTVRAQFARDRQGEWQIEQFAAPEQAEPPRTS